MPETRCAAESRSVADTAEAVGTNPTCRGGLTMSVDRGRPRRGTAPGQSDAVDPEADIDQLRFAQRQSNTEHRAPFGLIVRRYRSVVGFDNCSRD